MGKFLPFAGLLVVALALVGTAAAGKVGLAKTWVYDPGNLGTASATWTKDGLSLQKDAPLTANLAAGVEFKGLEGQMLTKLSFDVKGYCGAGAPRFNVSTDAGTSFFGCTYGTHTPLADGWERVVFSGGAPGTVGAFAQVLEGVDVVMDESGRTLLRNITVNGVAVDKFPHS